MKYLNIKEDYMNSGLFFATAKQIQAFECPSDLSLVLFLVKKPQDYVIINENKIKSNNNQK